ncbi:MAG: uracil-DNA glycosylase [Candidatus Limnocylindrales bacterium]|jgi:DNA polymerase
MANLAAVRLSAEACQRCDLWKTRKHVVFGGVDGYRDIEADVMIVGEAPGAEEDAEGLPFEGAAGRKLTRVLAEAGLDRRAAYLTNVVKCRPPGNRRTHPGEIAQCWDYLDAQIALVRPRVIVALGSTATRRLLGPRAHVGTSRGPGHFSGDCPVVATYHPAALNRKKGRRDLVLGDLTLAKRLLDAPDAT